MALGQVVDNVTIAPYNTNYAKDTQKYSDNLDRFAS